jgi:hypothetical protein
MVAGACNHPNCLVLRFDLELTGTAAQPSRSSGQSVRQESVSPDDQTEPW